MRVLLVDDEGAILSTLTEILADLGHSVRSAEDGEEALQAALDEPFDLVVSDIRMPRMDGLKLVEALRDRGLDVPVILITGHGTDDIAARASLVDAVRLLHKPIKIRDLLAGIRALDLEGDPRRRGPDLPPARGADGAEVP